MTLILPSQPQQHLKSTDSVGRCASVWVRNSKRVRPPDRELHVTTGLVLRNKFVVQWEVWRCGFSLGGHKGWLGTCHYDLLLLLSVQIREGAPGSVFQQALSYSYPEFKKSRLREVSRKQNAFLYIFKSQCLCLCKTFSLQNFRLFPLNLSKYTINSVLFTGSYMMS